MRIPRIYHNAPLNTGQTCELNEEAAAHVGRVLRMNTGDMLQLFNGDGNNYMARIEHASKKNVTVSVTTLQVNDNESPLHIHLGQVISRGDRMDFTLQKSVELGVNTITPLFSERCGVKLNGERLEKKVQQWQKIVISACEQSGRSHIPLVRHAMSLEHWCAEPSSSTRLNLHPRASLGINGLKLTEKRIRLLIGPEGGLSDTEIAMTQDYQFTDILLGPRVLRTETAALCAISALQLQFGDLS